MSTVVSADGTAIAYDTAGDGPPLILVDGAMCYRDSGPAKPFAKKLAKHFTVYTYDRRGRGESGDTAPYAPQREVDDIAALLTAAGGSAFVFGQSSGAVLAADAARLPGVTALAVYEPPFIVDDTHAARPEGYLAQMDALVAAGRRSDAVKMFLRSVGVPAPMLAVMSVLPVFKKLTSVAHALPYDFRVLGDTGRGLPLTAGRWDAVTAPALVMAGGKSPLYMRNGARALAAALGAPYRELPGQTHLLKADAVTPVLVEFFTGAGDRSAR